MQNEPALHGWLSWNGLVHNASPDQKPTAYSEDLRLWLKNSFLNRGEASYYKSGEGENAIVCSVFGKFFSWPGLEKAELAKVSPAKLVSEWLYNDKSLPDVMHGEFVLVIWEKEKRRLSLLTDPMGTRPFHYVSDKEGVAFATDIQSLKNYTASPEVLDQARLQAFFSQRPQSFSERILISGVEKLNPGCCVEILRDRIVSSKYWCPENAPLVRYGKKQDYYDHARALLKESVLDRTPLVGKIGVHVSGGLDSSAIAALACEHRRTNGLALPHGFAWQPAVLAGSEPTLEQELLSECCNAFGIECSNFEQNQKVISKYFSFDPVDFPIVGELLSELGVIVDAEKRGITTILSGWGGDEAFSFAGKQEKHSGWFRFLITCLMAQIRYKGRKLPVYYLGGVKKSGRLDMFLRMMSRRTTRQTMLHSLKMNNLYRRMDCWSIFAAHQNFQYSYPLLDTKLLEFALGVPPELFRDGNHKRMLMREAMRGYVPDQIRMNKHKYEPARIAAVLESFKDASGGLLKQLEEEQYNTDRSRHIDTNFLKENVQRMKSGETIAYSKTMQALSFIRIGNQ